MDGLGDKIRDKRMGGGTLKFLVDALPYFDSDCPFFEGHNCKIDKRLCERLSESTEDRDRGLDSECRWLKAA